jgi:hypothetical protein
MREILKIRFADHCQLSSKIGVNTRWRISSAFACRMSAIGRPLPGTAARKIDSGRRQLDVGLVVFCALGRRPHACWNVPVVAVEEDPTPGLYPRGVGEVSPEGSKSRIFGCFREESPPQDARAASPPVPSTSNAKVRYELALCHSLCWRRKISRDPLGIHLSIL